MDMSYAIRTITYYVGSEIAIGNIEMYTEKFCKELSDKEDEFYKDAAERVEKSTRPYNPTDAIDMAQSDMYYHLQVMFDLIDDRY